MIYIYFTFTRYHSSSQNTNQKYFCDAFHGVFSLLCIIQGTYLHIFCNIDHFSTIETPALIHDNSVVSFPKSTLYIIINPGWNLHIKGIFPKKQRIREMLIRDWSAFVCALVWNMAICDLWHCVINAQLLKHSFVLSSTVI